MGETRQEEADGRFELSAEHAEMIRVNLPVLLRHIKHIGDPRDPRKIKHSLTCLMLFGILHFVYQMSSRREANRKMTGAEFADKLKTFFPEFGSVPHADTLARLLKRIDPAEIEGAHIAFINGATSPPAAGGKSKNPSWTKSIAAIPTSTFTRTTGML